MQQYIRMVGKFPFETRVVSLKKSHFDEIFFDFFDVVIIIYFVSGHDTRCALTDEGYQEMFSWTTHLWVDWCRY